MAYLRHSAHPLSGLGNGVAFAADSEDPQSGPGIRLAMLVWLMGFLLLAAAILWDLLAALLHRS